MRPLDVSHTYPDGGPSWRAATGHRTDDSHDPTTSSTTATDPRAAAYAWWQPSLPLDEPEPVHFPCADCGVSTVPDRPGHGEYYMVHDDVWHAAGMVDGFLCIGCLEARLGRRVDPGDFPSYPVNDPGIGPGPWRTPRLIARLTGTAGPPTCSGPR